MCFSDLPLLVATKRFPSLSHCASDNDIGLRDLSVAISGINALAMPLFKYHIVLVDNTHLVPFLPSTVSKIHLFGYLDKESSFNSIFCHLFDNDLI